MYPAKLSLAALLVLFTSVGCSSEEKSCTDFCGNGAACVDGSCVAVSPCTPACGTGTVCQAGACVATLDSACAAGCKADEVCVATTGSAQCIAACGAGQAWDSSAKKCVATDAYCGAGQTWNATTQKCVPTEAYCGAGQTWDATAQKCVPGSALCGPGQTWNATKSICETTNVHAAALTGPFTKGQDVTAVCLKCHANAADDMLASAHYKWAGATPGLVDKTGAVQNDGSYGKKRGINNFCVAVPSNEGRCIECHAGYGDPAQKKAAYALPADPKNVDCLICHADLSTGYIKAQKNWGLADVKPTTGCTPACSATQVCLSIAGAPTCVTPAATDTAYQAKLSDVLQKAAVSVRKPARENCGKCHFYAGGADNVKLGDLGSPLAAPTSPSVDVHMGKATSPLTCSDCHAAQTGFRHNQIKGTGVSVAMVSEGAVSCKDCHATLSTTMHTSEHLAKVSCQTCHIPSFSRQMPTKTNWDWSFAGFKDCKYPGAPAEIVAACDTNPASANFGTAKATVSGVDMDYSWQKGVFQMKQSVTPAYRWYNGTGTHAFTTGALASFLPTEGVTPAQPISLAAPAATRTSAGAQVTPFKLMGGRQPVMKDGSFLITPHLFGAFGLWGTRPDPTLATTTTSTSTIPVIPTVSTAAPAAAKYGTWASYADYMVAVWNEVVTWGAAAAGQLSPVVTVPIGAAVHGTDGNVVVTAANSYAVGAKVFIMSSDPAFAPGIKTVSAASATSFTYKDDTLLAPAAAATSTVAFKAFKPLVHGVDWTWSYTEMLMNTNHEVMPKASALGAGNKCSDCHSASPKIPMCTLYAGAATKPFGVSCP